MQSAQPHNVLLTGASGYLGGSLVAGLKSSGLSGYDKIYALDAKAVRDVVMQNKISVVFYLIDVFESTAQENLIKALGDLRQTTGQDVHFLHTSGAKIFSSDAGAPTDRELLDTDPNLYDIQKGQKASAKILQKADGKGAGFGNTVSIQTTDIVKAAIASGRVHSVTPNQPTWPVCHISDNTALYLQILRSILEGKNIGHGRNGYCLAASGSIAWDDIYAAMALGLKVRGIIEDETVAPVDDIALVKMAQGLNTDPSLVAMRVGGKCTLTAEHGGQIGWSPRFCPTHILEAADVEVEHILRYMDHRAGKF
ncbi:hypothetical protein CGCF415_v007582 [Colletotrichum fructicola]|nr:hypothetical protein CGCF415_v007582 [Colletotrichum fructicola]